MIAIYRDPILTYNLIKSGMSSSFRGRTRREDLSDYIDADTMELPMTYEKFGAAIKSKCQSFMKIFFRRNSESMFESMPSGCFYRKIQPYRAVPRRPFTSDLIDKLRLVKRGFEPEEVAMHRWQKEEQREKQREQAQKELLIERAIVRRSQEFADWSDKPKKKVIRKHLLDLQEEEEDLQKWELLEKKILLAADSIRQKQQPHRPVQEHQKVGFFQACGNKPIAIPAQTSQSPVSTETDEPSTPATSKGLSTPTFSPTTQSHLSLNPEIISLDDNLAPSKVETFQETKKETVSANPFKDPPRNSVINLMDLITQAPSQNPIFANSRSQKSSLPPPFPFQNPSQPQQNIMNSAQNSIFPIDRNPFSSQNIKQQQKGQHSNPQNTPFPNSMNNRPFSQAGAQSQAPQINQFFQNNSSYQKTQGNFQHQSPFQIQNQPQSHSQGMFSSAVSNPNIASQAGSYFEANQPKKNQSISLFDSVSKISDKTDKKAATYKHKKKHDNSVRIA